MLRQSIRKVLQKLRTRWQTLAVIDVAFVLFSAQELFLLMSAVVIFEVLGLPGIVLNVVSLILALAFDRSMGKILVRVLRRHFALFVYMIFQISFFGVIGIVGLGLKNVPAKTIYGSLGLGLWASLVCFFQSYRAFEALQETHKLGLDVKKLNETFMRLPAQIRAQNDVLQGYSVALYVIPTLFSSHEYLFTVIAIGSIIQKLLDLSLIHI